MRSTIHMQLFSDPLVVVLSRDVKGEEREL